MKGQIGQTFLTLFLLLTGLALKKAYCKNSLAGNRVKREKGSEIFALFAQLIGVTK